MRELIKTSRTLTHGTALRGAAAFVIVLEKFAGSKIKPGTISRTITIFLLNFFLFRLCRFWKITDYYIEYGGIMRTILVILLLSTTLFANEFIKKADSLRAHRADNFNPETLIADSTNVNPAIDLLKKAVETTEGKEQEEAVWKLLRTYYFKGYYCTDNSDMKQLIYDQGKELGEKFLEKYPESPGINVWTAILWGVWGEEHGIVAAATSGVAGKMRDYCEKAIEVDPEWSNGAAYRILGRLHFKAPNIPFVLGWPDNDDAIENLEKARKIDPDNLFIKQVSRRNTL